MVISLNKLFEIFVKSKKEVVLNNNDELILKRLISVWFNKQVILKTWQY